MARPAHAPAYVEPMVARLVEALPEGREWIYEAKLDGYRALLSKEGPEVRLRSRNDKDLSRAYPEVVAAGRRLRSSSVLLDGEVVAVDGGGVPSFQALQHRSAHRDHRIVFYAFDLLHLDVGLRARPLTERTARLRDVVGDSGILVSEPLAGTASQVLDAVRGLGLEGVIAKRRDSLYEASARSGAWLKVKTERQQELVIGGYRPGPAGVDALVVGYYDRGLLKFAAKVRAGFTPHVRREVHERLQRLHAAACPFTDLPTGGPVRWGGGILAAQMSEFQWTRPEAVAQIRFVEWTSEGHLRHAAFMGLRDDKAAREITRE